MGDDFRAAVDRLIKELTEAAAALTEMNAFEQSVSAWRAFMASIARQVEDPRKQKHLLKVVGYGSGSPRSSKEMKDLLALLAPAVKAAAADLRAVGADEEDLGFPAKAMVAEELASGTLMSERADVNQARAQMRSAYDALTGMLRSMALGVEGARQKAILKKDKPALARADALQARFDQAISQARVDARQRAEAEEVPPELTSAVPPATGGNNDGN